MVNPITSVYIRSDTLKFQSNYEAIVQTYQNSDILAKEQFLVELLMKEGVYPKKPTPAMKEQGYTPFDMYEGWGVLWAFYDEPLKCPHCKKSLKDVKNGPPFKLEIGIYDTTRDITTHFECPDCHGIIGKYYHE